MTTTLEVSEELATHIKAHGDWLPTIIELSLAGFQTPIARAATEMIQFLSRNPKPQQVLDFYVSDAVQLRVRRLFELNSAGRLSAAQNRELDELDKLEKIAFKLKVQIAKQLSEGR